MGQLAKLVRFCFGLQALSLIAGVPVFLIAVLKLTVTLAKRQAAPDFFLFTLLLAFGGLALDIIPAIAWWHLRRGNPQARIWALAASAVNIIPVPGALRSWAVFSKLFHLPMGILGALIGIAGLIVFARRDVVAGVAHRAKPQPPRLAGDGTSKAAERFAAVVAVAWIFLSFHWWRSWGGARHLDESEFLVWLVELQVAILICIFVHESGHVAAGWASHMKLRSLQIGPFRWAHRRGRWKFKMVPSLGGVTGMAPTRLDNVRSRSTFFTLGGPVASLLLAGLSCIAALTAKGHFWEPAWVTLSTIATIASTDFVVNLIPQRPETSYSDGARIYQLVTNGPWARVEQAFSMVASTLVTSLRPRDYDIGLIRNAGNFLAQGDRGMLLRLYACMHYLELGQNQDAIRALEEAESLYQGVGLQSPAGVCATFVFVNAIFKRDRAAAERWWHRLQACRNIDFDAEYWQARASILWLQGQSDAAREALERGNTLARELPSAGAYEHVRWSQEKLAEALDQAPPSEAAPESTAPVSESIGQMLNALASDEAPVEARAITDPAA